MIQISSTLSTDRGRERGRFLSQKISESCKWHRRSFRNYCLQVCACRGIRSIGITMRRCAKLNTPFLLEKGVQLPRKKTTVTTKSNNKMWRVYFEIVNAFFNELFCCGFSLFFSPFFFAHFDSASIFIFC